ncbi:MAG TPA: Omp28-related outer membrane protein [bacterium]
MLYPTRVAAVEWHPYTSYPLGLLESYQRWFSYPAPYYYWNGVDSVWAYATPWLWVDGDKDPAYLTGTWRSKTITEMNKPSPLTCTMWGNYTLTEGTGTIYAKFRNDSTATISGRIRFVLTEDSIYYAAPTGDLWHNHVARDYIPDTSGTAFTLAPGDSITTSRSFTVQAGWNQNRCKLIAWAQSTTLLADSTRDVWQSGIKNVADLIVDVDEAKLATLRPPVVLAPNPCVNEVKLSFSLYQGLSYTLNIYDITGRRISTFRGIAAGDKETVTWNLRNDTGARVTSGVYFYRFDSARLKNSGKIVVK